VIGYGSWYTQSLRKQTSFADVYLVVDDYSRFHARAFHAWMNRRLPPNVYFIWNGGEDHLDIRGKYNVISAADLERECGLGLRDLYNAGRLTKLVWIAWVRDEATREWLITQLVEAHCTLTPLALGLLPERFSADDFSLELLGLSYRGDARHLLRRSRRRGYLRWPRIILTEPNLVDLAVNEAERKAGVHIDVTPRLRRHPLLYGLPEFLRVLRERNTQERIT